MKKEVVFFAFVLVWIGVSVSPGYACFDTYSFLNKQSMAYPYKLIALESSGEYVIGDMKMEEPDMFSGNLNVYYGLMNRLSVQASLASAEKERSQFKFDEWGIRGVFNLIPRANGIYNLDLIAEHRVSTSTDNTQAFEVSAPSIWYLHNLSMVVHPVLAFEDFEKAGLRGHGGIFYSANNATIVGLGGEYESPQSSANFGKRLVKGEAATSLFFGSKIGSNFFVQNELIKGWGADANDVGFALTFKVLFQTR